MELKGGFPPTPCGNDNKKDFRLKPKVIIIRTAGTNCDYETMSAFEFAGASVERIHINKLISRDISIDDYDIMAIPGGFSYGDDVASGKILANELKYKLGDIIREFDFSGKPVIGICNGFQVLVKMGILPGNKYYAQTATLTSNNSDKFECRWVYLKKQKSGFWTAGLPDIIHLPVAHGEGRFVTADDKILAAIEKNGQVALRYADAKKVTDVYPFNPNGSVNAIAGICNEKGNIFGLMPHPERNIFRWQNPGHDSSSLDKEGFGWGLQIFKNAVKHVK